MPALNEERYISAAIASIMPSSQEVQVELLVMDGGYGSHPPDRRGCCGRRLNALLVGQ
jgi:hypothetical protein